MSLIYEERASDSPFVETIIRGRTVSDGRSIRPAQINWHMVLIRQRGTLQLSVVGPQSTAGVSFWKAGAEILWIKFKLGTFMPHLPAKSFLDEETPLPGAASRSFWLHGSVWQFPDYENGDTFVHQLVRRGVLAHDPVVHAVLQGQPQAMAPRTLRHRFVRATGLTHSHIRQVERARGAAALLRQGRSIADTVYEAGYFDQPHLTRSLKQWVGQTPAKLVHTPDSCHSIQDSALLSGYDAHVLAQTR